MTAEVEHKNTCCKQVNVLRSCNASSLRGRYRSGHKGGRGHGKGGNGRSQVSDTILLACVDGKTIEGRHYSINDYHALIPAQKTKVKDLRS